MLPGKQVHVIGPYFFPYWDVLLAGHYFVYIPMITDKFSVQEAGNIKGKWISLLSLILHTRYMGLFVGQKRLSHCPLIH
jgi:hypothetical protein